MLWATWHRVLRGPQIQRPPCSFPLTSPTLFKVHCPHEAATLQIGCPGSFFTWGLAQSPSGWASPRRLSHQLPALPLPQTTPWQVGEGERQASWENPKTMNGGESPAAGPTRAWLRASSPGRRDGKS